MCIRDRSDPSSAYAPINFNTTLNLEELNALRQNLSRNIGFLNLNRNRIRSNEFTTLINHHQFAVNTIENMLKIKQLESDVKCGNKFSTDDLVYNNKGLIEQLPKRESVPEWERQFDQNLINPPCYTLPPSNVFKPRNRGTSVSP